MKEKMLRVMPHMCEQQIKDLADLIAAADEIGVAATSCTTQGGQGYTQLIDARNKFKDMLLETSERYRLFDEEEV